MPRIAGVDVPDRKKIRYGLRYIYGIGPKFADEILVQTGIDGETRANDLTEQQVSAIAAIIDANYLVEGALRRRFFATGAGRASRYEVEAQRLRRLPGS